MRCVLVKRLIVSLITLLLPFLVIFSVYRFVLGYGPLNSEAIVTLFGETFQGTFDRFGQLLDTVSNIYDLAQTNNGVPIWNPPQDNAFLEFVVTAFNTCFYALTFIISLLMNIGDVISAIGGLLLIALSDIVDFLRILTVLLIDSSPYVVDPYYPVG